MTRIGITVACCAVSVAPALAANLVINGGFETGTQAPWQTFQGWGSGITRTFNSTEPGRVGNYCLRLRATDGSFGVYQEVTTIPGHQYRIDAYWKGVKTGDPTWFEIILIDGPFSLQQADQQPYVALNFMYAYDPAPFSFPWTWGHDMNGGSELQDPDRNNYNGVRTASGTKMTVVLKAGGVGGTPMDAFFDEVSLEDITVAPTISLNKSAISRTMRIGGTLTPDTFTVANSGQLVLTYGITDDKAWIDEDPTSGDSTGPTDIDTITVSYPTVNTLAVGTHTATITVSDPAATNNPQTVTVTVQVEPFPADFDADGDVDMDDFSRFQSCFNGPNRAPTVYCAAPGADFDQDGDVDLMDFGVFQGCFNGPNRPPKCG